jgi:protein-disulfide isomerase
MSSRVNERKKAARVVREQLARERRRQRTLWVSLAAVAVLVIAGMIGWAALASQDSAEFTAPNGVAAGDDTGVAVGSGPIKVDLYGDFICPACKAWEEANGAVIDNALATNKITLVFHPVAFLDGASSTRYSTRSSAASGCAAEGGKFKEYADALYENQPPEGGAGLSDDELIRVGGTVGLADPDFAECVRDGTYKPWTEHVTEAASARGVTVTPTIFVNGKEIGRTPEAFAAAIESPTP